MMLRQRTIKALTQSSGIGLHSGQRVTLTLRPAKPDCGIVFRRVDLPNIVEIPINPEAVTDTRFASTISSNGVKIHTTEHLMSACAGLGIDNLLVDVTAEELPILDGSAAAFVFLLKSAEIIFQNAPKHFCRVTRPIEVREGVGDSLKWARLEPHQGFKLSFEIDFQHPAVDSTGQRVEFDLDTGDYEHDIARARTFGFSRDFDLLRKTGLALGGGFDNAIVMDDYKILNSGGLRYNDEFVKHKLLDAMGDLQLLGIPLLASYSAFRSGHEMNNRLLRKLVSEVDAWEETVFTDEREAPVGFRRLSRAW